MSDREDGFSLSESDSETVLSSIVNPRPLIREKSEAFVSADPEDGSEGSSATNSEAECLNEENDLLKITPVVHPKKSEIDKWMKNFLENAYKSGTITDGKNSGSDHGKHKDIVVLDYEVDRMNNSKAGYRDAALSTMLTMKIKYSIEGDSEEYFEFFIIKTPPELDDARSICTLANVMKREIHFYVDVVPIIKTWLISQNVKLAISVPKCHMTKIDRPFLKKPVPDIVNNFVKAETLIVLEDLRPQGFGKRHYIEGLSLEETKAAIFELAKIHAISWSMQQKSNVDLNECFKWSHKPLEAAVLYDVLLQEGLTAFQEFLATEDAETSVHLFQHLAQFETKLRGILIDLFEPSQAPSPTCLTHMDSWADNLLFRVRDTNDEKATLEPSQLPEKEKPKSGESKSRSKSKKKRRIDDSPLECRIVDWQMMGVGRPTHDLALLLITSLTSEDRESYTNLLLAYYYQTFKETADLFGLELPFDVDCIMKEYEASKVLAVLFVLGSIDLVLPEAVTRHRLIAALYELVNENLI